MGAVLTLPPSVIGVATLDEKGHIRSANRAFWGLVGASEAMIGSTFGDVVSASSGGQRLFGDPRTFRHRPVETRLVGSAGRERLVRFTVSDAPEGLGAGCPFLVVGEDITERREAQHREHFQHAVADLLTVASPFGDDMLALVCKELGFDVGRLWLADKQQELRFMEHWHAPTLMLPRFVAASRAARRGVGDTLLGRVLRDKRPMWWRAEQRDRDDALEETARAEGLTSGVAFPIQLGSEVLGAMDFYCRNQREEDPAVMALAATVGYQVGQFLGRKRAEAALRGSQRQLRSILDNTPALVLVTQLDGRLVQINRRAAEVLQIDRAKAPGKRLDELLPASLAKPMEERHAEVLADWATHETEDRLVLGGETRFFLAQRFVLSDASTHPYAVCAILSDITANIRAEHDLRRLAGQVSAADDEARRKLARDIHDSIGQTLSAIKMDLGGAQRSLGRPAELGAFLDQAVAMLDQVIAETRSMTFDLYPAMLDDLGLVPTLENLATTWGKASGIAVTVTETGRRVELHTELRNYLFRAVKELLNNVRKHASASQVIVAVRAAHGRIRVQVADDGAGFDAERVLAPTERKGLGLADMRQHVAFLGGEMHIDAEPGRGTQIVVELPLEDEKNE